MFNIEELRLLELGLHMVRANSINEIDWARRDSNAPEGYEQEQRLKIERVKILVDRLREMESCISP